MGNSCKRPGNAFGCRPVVTSCRVFKGVGLVLRWELGAGVPPELIFCPAHHSGGERCV